QARAQDLARNGAERPREDAPAAAPAVRRGGPADLPRRASSAAAAPELGPASRGPEAATDGEGLREQLAGIPGGDRGVHEGGGRDQEMKRIVALILMAALPAGAQERKPDKAPVAVTPAPTADRAIARGVAYLRTMQKEDGSITQAGFPLAMTSLSI